MQWLKATATRIKEMELERMRCVMNSDFGRAYSLLKGIKFARNKFAKISNQLRREGLCK